MSRVEKINEKVIVLIIDDNKNSSDKLVALMTRDKRQSVTGSGGLCVKALVRPQLSLYSVLMYLYRNFTQYLPEKNDIIIE